MITYSAKKSLIYKELKTDLSKEYFDFKPKKFLHNLDSLYYSVKVKNDWTYDEGVKRFLELLEFNKKKSMETFEPYVCFTGPIFSNLKNEYVMHGLTQGCYMYDVSVADKFLIFIMGTQLNDKTPELVVQIRSQNLWLNGEYKALLESIKEVEKLLSVFEIEIEEIKENRIDYAYHTNYIQDPTNYFQPKNFNRMQKSKFERWSLEGSFSGEYETDVDYFTLGRKKSNNLFLRIYDKTKEVIEQGYKQFFIKLWYMEGMISYYDMYCIEKAFLQPSRHNYKYMDIARLHFYLEFGADPVIKNQIKELIYKDSIDYAAVIALADILTPKVTIILNVEIETKRKFYYSLDNSIDNLLSLKTKDVPEYANRIFVKLDNKQVFHDFITCNNETNSGVIRFLDYKAKNKEGKTFTRKENMPNSDFWNRLQRVKVNKKFKVDNVELMREYQKTLSVELLKKKIANSISTYSLYVHGDDVQNSLINDSLDFMSTLNENDHQKAIQYKKKKITQLRNRLDQVDTSVGLDKKYRLLDCETGESHTSYE